MPSSVGKIAPCCLAQQPGPTLRRGFSHIPQIISDEDRRHQDDDEDRRHPEPVQLSLSGRLVAWCHVRVLRHFTSPNYQASRRFLAWRSIRRPFGRTLGVLGVSLRQASSLCTLARAIRRHILLAMPKMRAKSDLPAKPCRHCGKPMVWRKAWARTWNDVLYCSDRCRGEAAQARRLATQALPTRDHA